MSLTLRPMDASEFETYKRYFIEDYAQEIMDNYGHSNLVALKMAKDAISTSFPDGVTPDNDRLLCIDLATDKTVLVGYLWQIVNQSDKSCFISDFYILPDMRNQGLGKLAITVLEARLKLEGIEQIKLRVANQNKRATQLYEDIGFNITGINMSKLI